MKISSNKSLTSSQPNHSQSQLLSQLLKLKPQRAVQRLLQQNSIDQSFEFYNFLQQNVKTNTNQLRQVLYKNHENLCGCSEMIQKIKDFNEKIKSLQQNINQIIINEQIKQDHEIIYDKSTSNLNTHEKLMKVQQFIQKKQYYQALLKCQQMQNIPIKNDLQLDSNHSLNFSYIKFLKVQILEYIEKDLQQSSLNNDLISSSIKSILVFMEITSIKQLEEIVQKSNQLQDSSNTLLESIFSKYNQTQIYPLTSAVIIQLIFQFKLLSIKDQVTSSLSSQTQEQRVNRLEKKVFNFFSDVDKLLTRQQGNEKQKLYKIFRKNIEKIVKQISQIFITDKRNASNVADQITITFQTQLYQSLLNSGQFIQLLNRLSKNLRQVSVDEHQQRDIDLFNMIKHLWKDFSHQLIDIIIEKANPLANQKGKKQQRTLSYGELKKFQSKSSLRAFRQSLTSYRSKLDSLFLNLNQLFKKSKTQQKQQLISQILRTIHKIQSQLNDHITSIISAQSFEISLETINQLLMTYFLTEAFNNGWESVLKEQTQNEKYNFLADSLSTYVRSGESISLNTFTNTKTRQSRFLEFYEIVDGYLTGKIKRHPYLCTRLTPIEQWQQQFDILIGGYSKNMIANAELVIKFQKTILQIVALKLSKID